MKVLFVSPTPFYQDRGTPIAVNLFLKTLSKQGHHVDLLTFHEGVDVCYPNLTIHRIKPFKKISGIRPGFSVKKIICDVYLFAKMIKHVIKNDYDVIHALEEASFMAMLVSFVTRIPFVYDMDSVLSQQLMEKFSFLRPFSKILYFFESLPVRSAAMVIPVCKEIEKHAIELKAKMSVCIKDIALPEDMQKNFSPADIVSHKKDSKLMLYVGNLEHYQGIDFLLSSFKLLGQDNNYKLMIVGGNDTTISKYKDMTMSLGIDNKVVFLGAKPLEELYSYLKEADILVSPRIIGNNTPMKIYSYLDSGVPVLATDILSHTQVLTSEIACLAEPDEKIFAYAMRDLFHDEHLRSKLAQNAKGFISENHSMDVMEMSIGIAYKEIYALTLALKKRKSRKSVLATLFFDILANLFLLKKYFLVHMVSAKVVTAKLATVKLAMIFVNSFMDSMI